MVRWFAKRSVLFSAPLFPSRRRWGILWIFRYWRIRLDGFGWVLRDDCEVRDWSGVTEGNGKCVLYAVFVDVFLLCPRVTNTWTYKSSKLVVLKRCQKAMDIPEFCIIHLTGTLVGSCKHGDVAAFIPVWEKEHHLQKRVGKGHVSYQESSSWFAPQDMP